MGYKLPLEIKLQLTEKCNYDCSFCFNRRSFSQIGRAISRGNAKQVIQKTADEGIKGVRFTGGEPLLHPALPELLSLANKKGLYVTLNTNASLINEKNAKGIAENTDALLVSMHSLPANKRTADALAIFSSAGCSLRAATILTRGNIQILERFHETISGMPFSQWVLLRQIPNSLDKKPVSAEDMQLAVEKIESFNGEREKKDRFLIENALPFCCFFPERVERVALGGIHEDGHSSLFVAADSKIKPSYFFDIVLGNALRGSFLDAWKSDFMQRMNRLEFIAEICHECKYALKCMSGSRYAALLVNKSLYALDPLAKPQEFLPELKRNE